MLPHVCKHQEQCTQSQQDKLEHKPLHWTEDHRCIHQQFMSLSREQVSGAVHSKPARQAVVQTAALERRNDSHRWTLYVFSRVQVSGAVHSNPAPQAVVQTAALEKRTSVHTSICLYFPHVSKCQEQCTQNQQDKLEHKPLHWKGEMTVIGGHYMFSHVCKFQEHCTRTQHHTEYHRQLRIGYCSHYSADCVSYLSKYQEQCTQSQQDKL